MIWVKIYTIMNVTVKFFASLKEQFNQPSMNVELSSNQTTVEDIWKEVSGSDHMPENVLSAINLEYAKAEQTVKAGDEIAFFPPVTGG